MSERPSSSEAGGQAPFLALVVEPCGWVEPIEVAHAIAWLLSPMSSGVTGINLPVDAGYIAGTTWAAYGGLREAPSA